MTPKHFTFTYRGTLTVTALDDDQALEAAGAMLPDSAECECVEEYEVEKEDKSK